LALNSDLIREDIQMNRNQIRTMFGVWLQKADKATSPHHLVDHLTDHEDERYDWDHYFVVDRSGDRVLRPTSTLTGPAYGTDWSDNERDRIRLRNDYFRRGGYICSSIVQYSTLKRAKNLDKQWKFVINLDEKLLGQHFRQTVRLEQCM
jgi:hypothetical protein